MIAEPPKSEAELAALGVHLIPVPTPFIVGPVNSILVEGDPLTLIDTATCTDESWVALESGLKEKGYAFSDIERIILTHHHADHTGLLRRVVAQSHAETWGHPELVRQAELSHEHDDAQRLFFMNIMSEFGVPEETADGAMALWAAFKNYTEPITIDHTVDDGGMVGPYRVWFVPGHSATDTLFVHETQGYTVAGDHLLKVFNPNPLIRRPEPGMARAKSLLEFRASLLRSRSLDLGYVIPGHGAPFDDHRAVVDGLLEQLDKRSRRLMNAMSEEGITPYAVAKSLYPDVAVPNLYLALSVAIGQLELLEEEGILQAEHREGILHYLPVH